MESSYQIKRNLKGHKILAVKGVLPVDSFEKIKSEDFDVIYLVDYNQSHYELSVQLQNLSPFHSLKCHLKPRFLAPTLKDRVKQLEVLIDGYASNLDDKEMNNRIDEIYENLKLIETFDISEVKHNNYMYFLKLCKYAISRGMMTYTITMESAYAQGHTALYLAKRNNLSGDTRDEFNRFNYALEELGYARRTKFVERIHVCPHCKNSHLYYMEVCPKCESSNLKEEPVLHHFRCANISPESTYAYDGELRCPKCHHFLRHIGVDYDRPSNVYTCRECNHTFLHTKMKVYCGACHKTSRPAELVSQDLYSYELTPEGILALSSNDAVIAVSKDIWAGYSKFESFLSQIRLFSYSHEKNEMIYVNRFRVEGDNVNKEIIMSIVGELQKRYHYNNLSYNRNYVYMATKASTGMSEALWKQVEEEHEDMLKIIDLKYAGIVLTDQMFLKQEKGERIDAFIERISKVNG